MDALEYVPQLPPPYGWVRNHSRHQLEIWKQDELIESDGKPVATITDESLSNKTDPFKALRKIVANLTQKGTFSND